MLQRNQYREAVRLALSRNPMAALIGPRQCGKTTLARELLQGGGEGNAPHYPIGSYFLKRSLWLPERSKHSESGSFL